MHSHYHTIGCRTKQCFVRYKTMFCTVQNTVLYDVVSIWHSHYIHICPVCVNPLKTIWFCYNTHFPLTPVWVYSGLVFNGLKLDIVHFVHMIQVWVTGGLCILPWWSLLSPAQLYPPHIEFDVHIGGEMVLGSKWLSFKTMVQPSFHYNVFVYVSSVNGIHITVSIVQPYQNIQKGVSYD